MQQTTEGVNLYDLLRRALTSHSEGGVSDGKAEQDSPAVPAVRTSEDRSRMQHKVLEELERRRQKSQNSYGVNGDPATNVASPAVSAEPNLFGDVTQVNSSGICNATSHHQPRLSRRVNTDIRDLVANAYRSLFRRLPEDHVILNPQANAEFIVRCRELGATTAECILNRTLLNIRKSGWNAGLDREPVVGLHRETFDRIGHTVEIAASLIQREWFMVGHEVPSVDDILCNPELRLGLTTYVTRLQSGVDAIDCCLALLAFRKSGRQSTLRLCDVDLPERNLFASLKSIDPADVPNTCGIYRITCRRKPVFVSATTNLQKRLRQHIEGAGGALLPETFPFRIEGPLSVEVYEAPPSWLPRRAEAVARSMRIDKYPPLNWREKSVLFEFEECIVERRAAVC